MQKIFNLLFLAVLCAGATAGYGQTTRVKATPTPTPVPSADDYFKAADFDELVKSTQGMSFSLAVVMAPENIEDGKLDEAIAALTRSIAEKPDAWVLSWRGMAYFLKSDLPRALSDANVALALKPDYPRALDVRALVERSQGQNELSKKDFDLAIAASTKAIADKPGSMDDYFARGETYRLMGENAKAAADYRKTLQLSPGYGHAQARLDLVTGTTAKPPTKAPAKPVTQPTPTTDPEKMAAFKKAADEYKRLDALLSAANDKIEKTENAMMAENKKNGRDQHARPAADLTICTQLHDADELFTKTFDEFFEMQQMSEAGDLEGRPDLQDLVDEAEYSIDGISGYIAVRQVAWSCPKQSKISATTPPKPVAILTREDDLSYRTKLAIDIHATDGILAELNDAIAKNKKDALAYALRGDIYMAKESVLLARADYDQAIKLDSKNSMYYYKRGRSFESSPDYSRERASVDYTKAIELDPNNEDALRDRGFNYTLVLNDAAAMADLLKATKLKPDDHKSQYWLAGLYVKANDVDNALASFALSIATKRDDPYPYVERGQVYEFLKRYDDAIADYSKVVQLLPNDYIGYGNRADVYAKAQRYALAEADFTKGIDLKKNDASAYVQRARFYTKWGKYDEALEDYKTSMSLAAYNKSALSGEFNALIDLTNAARANGKQVADTYNPLLDVYSPLLKQAGDKMDAYTALKKNSPAATGQLCSTLLEIAPMVIRATEAFVPILDMYDNGKLKGFSGPISFAEDNKWRLTGTVKYVREQQAALKCP